jgi:CRP/FNR family nitrogen fixation transcriptional regulator
MAMRSVKSEGAMTEDGGIIVELPMSRADIADYLGLTIETVSRLISKLRAQRIITLRKAQEIVLLRRDLLEEMSEAAA